MSPRGTNPTRSSALPPSLRSGRRTPRAGAREPRGYGALSRLVVGSTARNDSGSGVRFRAARSARIRGDVLTFRWEMLLADSETALASGLEFLIVDDDGRILLDHPFAVA